MRNVVLWKQVFLGASLFLCGTSPVMATEVGDLVPDVRGNALQQDGRRVTCTISDKAVRVCSKMEDSSTVLS